MTSRVLLGLVTGVRPTRKAAGPVAFVDVDLYIGGRNLDARLTLAIAATEAIPDLGARYTITIERETP